MRSNSTVAKGKINEKIVQFFKKLFWLNSERIPVIGGRTETLEEYIRKYTRYLVLWPGRDSPRNIIVRKVGPKKCSKKYRKIDPIMNFKS